MSSPSLKKRLGQHHLLHGGLVRPLVEFLRPAEERVVEIGPGGGVLTRELLAAGAERVVAWEVDPGWAVEVRREVRDPRLAVVVGDALEIDWRAMARRGPVVAAGNLPYNVATPILERLLPHRREVPRAGFLVQWEVGERLVARPGDAAYGSLSVLVAAYAEARIVGRVKRGSFRPPPKVDGAFVGLALREPPLPDEAMPGFLATVRLAFARRRKTLRNSLAAGLGRARAGEAVEELARELGRDPRVRAEELGLAELVALHRTIRRAASA